MIDYYYYYYSVRVRDSKRLGGYTKNWNSFNTTLALGSHKHWPEICWDWKVINIIISRINSNLYMLIKIGNNLTISNPAKAIKPSTRKSDLREKPSNVEIKTTKPGTRSNFHYEQIMDTRRFFSLAN